MVNVHVIVGRLQKLREYLGFLKTLGTRAEEEFIADPLLYGSAERFLQLSIQIVLDVGNHVLSDRKLKEPEGYGDILRLLGEHGVIPPELAGRMAPLAGLRNILVHEYLEIDRRRLYRAIRDELKDLEHFAEHIGKTV